MCSEQLSTKGFNKDAQDIQDHDAAAREPQMHAQHGEREPQMNPPASAASSESSEAGGTECKLGRSPSPSLEESTAGILHPAPAASHASAEDALWLAYRQKGSVELRNRIVMLHGPWAERRARMFARVRRIDWREVWGAAALGLIEAVERFDPGGGVPFRAYASQRVQGALMDAAREACRQPGAQRRPNKDNDTTNKDGQDRQDSRGRQLPADPVPPYCSAVPASHENASYHEIESRLLAAMPDPRSREIARRRFWFEQSVDEIAYYMDIRKSRVEEIMQETVLPRARRLCVKLGIRPKRRRIEGS